MSEKKYDPFYQNIQTLTTNKKNTVNEINSSSLDDTDRRLLYLEMLDLTKRLIMERNLQRRAIITEFIEEIQLLLKPPVINKPPAPIRNPTINRENMITSEFPFSSKENHLGTY